MTVSTDREGAVGFITLDRPSANAFDENQIDDLDRALTVLETDSAIGSIVIRSAHRIFCAGADIAMMESWLDASDRGERLAQFSSRLQTVFARIESSSKPTVAALSGAATGGGLELALACDFRITGPSVRIGLPEVALGLLPGAGGTQRLTRLAGPSVAARLILGAELIDGTEAARLHIVHDATASDVDEESVRLAARLATLPPLAYTAAKQCIHSSRGELGYAREITEISRLIHTSDTAARLEKFVASR